MRAIIRSTYLGSACWNRATSLALWQEESSCESDSDEEGRLPDGDAEEDGYCSYDEDFEYSSPCDTGSWICIHRGKSQGWNFADFLAREASFASRKQSRKTGADSS